MRIEVEGGRRAFAPGDELAGQVSWILETAPDAVELRLFWYTEGKGTQDIGVVETTPFQAAQQGKGRFRFRAPLSPYSFSGRLLSIRWALELVAEPSGETVREDLVIGPQAREVEVHESA